MSGQKGGGASEGRRVLGQRSASEPPRPQRPAVMTEEEWLAYIDELHAEPRQIGGPVIASEQPDGVPPDHVVLRGGYMVPRLGLVQEAAHIFAERGRLGEEATFEFVRAVNKPGGPALLEGQARRLRERVDNAAKARDLSSRLSKAVEFPDGDDPDAPFRHPSSLTSHLWDLGLGKLRGVAQTLEALIHSYFGGYRLPEDAPVAPLRERVEAFLHAQQAVQHAEWERRRARLWALDGVLDAYDSGAEGDLWCWKDSSGALCFWKGDPPDRSAGPAPQGAPTSTTSSEPGRAGGGVAANLADPSRRLDHLVEVLIPRHGPHSQGGPSTGSWRAVASALEALLIEEGIPSSDWPYKDGGEGIHAPTLAKKVRARLVRDQDRKLQQHPTGRG